MQTKNENHLIQILINSSVDKFLKKIFLSRIKEGSFSRDENPTSHFCVFFAGYDPLTKHLFMGKHIKSGLWLFNGGHIDKDELPEETLHREMQEEWGVVEKTNSQSPSFFTITEIEDSKQKCKTHYDLWYFIPLNKNAFHPNKNLLLKEFHEWGWKSVDEAKTLVGGLGGKATLKGIDFIARL